jgi:adenosylcobinamide-GDP ribazoletransferase
MVLAPAVGGTLAVLMTGALWLLGSGSPLLVAALVIALLAAATRGIHLDGLADTADGLGSGRPAPDALEVMRRGDVGPFGAVTVVLVLLIQVTALGQLVAQSRGAPAICLALVSSRLVLPALCSRGVPAARADGLGASVAGSVTRAQLATAALLALVVLAVELALLEVIGGQQQVLGYYETTGGGVVRGAVLLVVPLGAGALLARHCVRRLGGVTGDVLGACVETTFTAVLALLCLL